MLGSRLSRAMLVCYYRLAAVAQKGKWVYPTRKTSLFSVQVKVASILNLDYILIELKVIQKIMKG